MEIYICADFSQDGIEMLKAAGHTVRTGGWGYTSHILDEDELIAEIGNAEILFLGYEPVTRKVLENTHLKAIFSIRGGARANVDVDAATELGIPVFCTFGREALPVADFTMGLILGLTRKIARANSELHEGVFTAPAGEFGSDKDVIWDMNPEGPWQSRKGIELEGKILGLSGNGLRALIGIIDQHVQIKALRALRHLLADRTEADQAEDLALQLDALA